MKAMVLSRIGRIEENSRPLEMRTLPEPVPAENEVRVRVAVCGVCHTEMDEIEGRTAPPQLPVVLGHQVVGRVDALGSGVSARHIGERVGVAWIYAACGVCEYCRSGRENLCRDFRATGRDANGGYAQYMTVREDFAYRIPEGLGDAEAAPLLCAGAIGYRSLRLAGLQDGQQLGLTGFGASGHLVLQMARYRYPNAQVFVFARSAEERAFARQLGAAWAGDITEEPPVKLDSIIDTTPAWRPVLAALQNLAPGGRLVINAISKEAGDKDALLNLDYPTHLWLEKEIKSVANITRRDVSEFLALAAEMGLKPEVEEYALEDANRALIDLRQRHVRGAKVLRVE